MKLGQITLSLEVLGAMLSIPPEHVITAVLPPSDMDVACRQVRLLVEGPHMPEHPEGMMPARVRLIREGNGRTYFDFS